MHAASVGVLDAGVVVRRYGHEFRLHAVAHVECLDEFVDCLFGHVLVGACERLQSLVWMRVCLTTEDGLDGFCHYCPCVVEVFLELLLVEDELAQTLECALDSDYAVAERYAYVCLLYTSPSPRD